VGGVVGHYFDDYGTCGQVSITGEWVHGQVYFDDCGTCGQVSITGEWVAWSGITLTSKIPALGGDFASCIARDKLQNTDRPTVL